MPEQRLVRLQKTMKVRANPSHALDHEGQPASVVSWPGDITRLIGATIDHARSKAEARVCFAFSDEPVVVPTRGQIGQYFVRKLREGELLPACEVSATFAPKAAAAPKGAG